MRYIVVSVLILIRLINQVVGQGPTPTSSPPPPASSSSPSSTSPTPTSSPSDPNNPTTPSPASTTGGPGGSTPTPTSTSSSGGSGGGSGTDNLPCIKNLLSLCEAYQFQFNKVSEEYGCTMFTNPFVFAFHTNLVESSMECDTIMQLEVMRQSVMTSKGQPGPSTHAF